MSRQADSGNRSEHIGELLREHGLRATPQRRAILRVFAATAGDSAHLSADDVFQRARADLPELSRATVYNALGELAAAGLLGLVEGPGPQRYDSNAEPHHHFRCRRCQQLYDVHPNGIAEFSLAEQGFRIEHTHVLLEGLCPDCA